MNSGLGWARSVSHVEATKHIANIVVDLRRARNEAVSDRGFAREAHSSCSSARVRLPIRGRLPIKNKHARLICGRRVVDRKGEKGKTGSRIRSTRVLFTTTVYRSRSEGHDRARSIETRATIKRESPITSRM